MFVRMATYMQTSYLRAIAAAPAFTDVSDTHPYFDAVQEIATREIVCGYPQADGTSLFKPENPVLRAQFAKMICGVMGLSVAEDLVAPFTDLGADDPTNLYPHEYVAVAAANNITKGTTPGSFSPWLSITRAQVLTMVVRAAQNLEPGALLTPPADYPGTLGNFSPHHADNARWAEYNGLLSGLQGFGAGWNPWQTASRGEVAQILYSLLGLLEQFAIQGW
jgi:hypothetical protein